MHLDATRPFPFPDATFGSVFSEHLIEHLPYEAGLEMLRESHRVLAPGGGVRVATPNLRALASLLSGDHDEIGSRYAAWLRRSYFPAAHGDDAVFALNQVMRAWGHQFIYDEPTLRATLEAVGFVDVEARELHDSTVVALAGQRPGRGPTPAHVAVISAAGIATTRTRVYAGPGPGRDRP